MSEFAGHLQLRAAVRADGRTILAAQSFRAPYHLSKPYWDPDSRTLLVQVVNPTAGILAGDRLSAHVAVDRGAAVALTTPSASRVFQMHQGIAASVQHFSVARDAWLEVAPEPLVPHRGSRFRQVTTIDVAPGGSLFYVDQLVPGRLGHGEAWQWETLVLEMTLRLGGELILRERMEQSGASLRELAEFGRSGPTACLANAVLIGASAPEQSAAWIAKINALQGEKCRIGVSALRQGGWSLKFVATDPLALRDGLRDLRAILAEPFQRLSADFRKL